MPGSKQAHHAMDSLTGYTGVWLRRLVLTCGLLWLRDGFIYDNIKEVLFSPLILNQNWSA